jgi:hypothetical protein
MFAHHPYELKFAHELRAKNKTLKDVQKKIDSRLSGEIKLKAWNPGGGTFTDCIGCGENVKFYTL